MGWGWAALAGQSLCEVVSKEAVKLYRVLSPARESGAFCGVWITSQGFREPPGWGVAWGPGDLPSAFVSRAALTPAAPAPLTALTLS